MSILGGCLFGIIALLLKGLLESTMTLHTLVLMAALAAAGFVLVQIGLKHGKASHTMLLTNVATILIPVGGGIALLGESVSVIEMTGMAMIITAACILMKK